MTASVIRLGFVPLLDCAILVAAREKGFAEAEGLDLVLSRETSWAAIRDKVAFGRLEGAHMLAGLPIAATLGVAGPAAAMIAPMALGQGGNAITVSRALFRRMIEAAPEAMAGRAGLSARALAAALAGERSPARRPPAFASVFPFSTHNYELRYWLTIGGLAPDRDVDLGVIAPPRMVDALRSGHIDGFCVGEPWNLIAVRQELGAVVASKADLWPAAPEKVLGLRADWAEANGDLLARLIRAFARAAAWADRQENRAELAAMLAAPSHIGVSEDLLVTALAGEAVLRPDSPAGPLPHRPIFFANAATFPWLSQAAWLIDQMTRWNQLAAVADPIATAARIYRPDLYRAALAGTGLPVPAADAKSEGAHDAAFTVAATEGPPIDMAPDRMADGSVFDPSAR